MTSDQPEFEQAFEREILLGEKLRVTLQAAIASVILLSVTVLFQNFRTNFTALFRTEFPIQTVVMFLCGFIAYELGIRALIQRAIERRQRPPKVMRYINTVIETSVPSLVLLLLAQNLEPIYLLLSPVPFLYFIFILLTSLRLDLILSLLSGVVASGEYLAIAHYAIQRANPALVDSRSLMLLPHIQKSFLLLLTGLATGFVTLQIKNRIFQALQSVEEKNRALHIFGQHVSPQVAQKLLNQKNFDSENRRVCIMFLDIRNFTRFSEDKKPEQVVDYLNTLFDFMIDVVNDHEGIINKFLGDGFMAIFGAPVSTKRDSQQAVSAALMMIHRVQQAVATGKIPPTTIGIGLHTGEVVTGNIGSYLRKEYTVIGDTVNLASRIEQLNKTFESQLLITDSVWQELDPLMQDQSVDLGLVRVKGLELPVQIYQLA